jgi:hypothetical protein
MSLISQEKFSHSARCPLSHLLRADQTFPIPSLNLSEITLNLVANERENELEESRFS